MIIYNTTYQMAEADARAFVVWAHEVYLPQVHSQGQLRHGRLTRILSHKEEGSECFAIQFETDSTATLHAWFVRQGQQLNQEMLRVFENRVVGFSTIMEEIAYE